MAQTVEHQGCPPATTDIVVSTKHAERPWEVIIEPDDEERLSVVITAYPVEDRT
jgi:hypothetical protein